MHFVSIEAIDGVELVACCDIKTNRAERVAKKYGCKAYTDYIEMLESENLDAVHICLPHNIHTDAAKEAFKRGVRVLSEKPMDVNYTDSVIIITNNLLFYTDHICFHTNASFFMCGGNINQIHISNFAFSSQSFVKPDFENR